MPSGEGNIVGSGSGSSPGDLGPGNEERALDKEFVRFSNKVVGDDWDCVRVSSSAVEPMVSMETRSITKESNPQGFFGRRTESYQHVIIRFSFIKLGVRITCI